MWRALVFLGLLALAAFGAVWLADRPGTVVVTWQGQEARTTVAVAAVLAVALAMALAVLWAGIGGLLRLPGRLTHASRARKRARGYAAVSRGMVAVGAGDAIAAKRHARDAEKLLGREPLSLLLTAQAAQVSGDRGAAETAFRRMAEDPETRVLGLRGLHVEARRRGDAQAALSHAMEAVRLAPAASWASDAVLEAQGAARDWRGALAGLERRASLGLVEKATARRHRAVLLTADALDRAEQDPDRALDAAVEATKLSPDLVPAAALAGRLLARRGDLRKAARILETAWKAMPHPDLADAYLHLRPGDSTLDRLARAETLAKLSSWDPEARIALAGAALDARDLDKARRTLEPLLHERPTVRVCLLMADLEELQDGAGGRTREWISRAARAPRDPVWIADGVVSDHWAPLSPVTGRLDAFEWRAPPDVLAAPSRVIDDVTADLDDKPAPVLAAPTAAAPAPAEAPAPVEPTVAADPPAPAAEPAAQAVAVPGDPSPEPAPAVSPAPSEAPPEALPAAPVRHDEEHAPTRPNGAAAEPAVFPVSHPPDDPGPRRPERRSGRFRLLG